MVSLTVPAGLNGKSILFCLGSMLPGIRASEAKRMLLSGSIKRNGVRIRQEQALFAGDVLDIYLPKGAKPYPLPEIAYADENLLVVNKHPGISVVRDREDGKPSLEQLLALNLGVELTACHRLDHNTGGLVIFAKNRQAFDSVSNAIAQKEITKLYQVIVVGRPPAEEGELTGYLCKDEQSARVRIANCPSKDARTIVTRYRLVRTNGSLSFLVVQLVTGRTHQIRAHLAFIGVPVLGDDKYGDRAANKRYGVKYQALWATEIVFHTKGMLAYLDGKTIRAERVCFPDVGL